VKLNAFGNRLARALALAGAAILAMSVTWGSGAGAQTADIVVAPGRLLGATRFQLAWLDWNAPRPVFLTALASPAVAHDVAALPGGSTALLSVAKPATSGRNWGVDPSDILGVDLSSAEGARVQPRAVLLRADPAESLSWPAWWPDGSAFVFQREDDAAPAVQSPDGFARPPARVELVQADGSARRVLVASGWQPSPAPDGSAVAFVRFTDRGASLLALGSSDGAEHVLVDAGVFPEIFSPRYSPDGKSIAFGARSFADLQLSAQPPAGLAAMFSQMQPSTASAHGTLADLWLVNADGSNLHQISNLRVHDPAVAWAPDGSQLFAYGEWGGVLIDLNSGENTLMTYLTGTTAVAWLP
jgi:hypothetical protein